MKTKRLPGWQVRLAELVMARERMPFAPGTNDCALFAADCVQAVTGADVAADVRGTYSDEKGMLRELKKLGTLRQLAAEKLGTLRQLAAERLGAEVPEPLAQIGDVGEVEGREALAVCTGQFFLAPGATGLVQVPRSRVLAVWRCTREE